MDDSNELLDLVDYDKHATELAEYIKTSLTLGDNINDIETKSIAIKGDWGMGKSFLVNLLKKKLKDEKYSNLNLNIVDFDPWKLAGNKNNEIEILKAVLNTQDKQIKRIEGYIKFADRTTKLFTAGILGLLILLAKPFGEYLLSDVLEPIFRGFTFFLPHGLEAKNIFSFIIFPVVPFISFVLLLLIALFLIYIEFKKTSYHDLDYFITNNTLIIIDNVDRCTPEETFDVLRCVEIYNKIRLKNVRIITMCIYKNEIVENAVRSVLNFENGDKSSLMYTEKLFKFPINLDCSKGLFISKWIETRVNKKVSKLAPSISECLEQVSTDILGNLRELDTKLVSASEFAKEKDINQVIFIFLLLLGSLNAPNPILTIIYEEEKNRNPEEKDFDKSINNFFKRDMNGSEGDYIKRVYASGNTQRTVPFKLHLLMQSFMGKGLKWKRYDSFLRQYYEKRILTQEYFRFFKSHMR